MASPTVPPQLLADIRRTIDELLREFPDQKALAAYLGVHESAISRAKRHGQVSKRVLAGLGFKRVTRFEREGV